MADAWGGAWGKAWGVSWGTAQVAPPPSGGYFDLDAASARVRRRPQEEAETARRAAEAIAEIAARQAERLEQDAQKRFEELERELVLRDIKWEAQYLADLNTERERLVALEIGERLRAAMADEEDVIALLVLAAGAAI